MSIFNKTELDQALERCESERIHQLGKIQPHGALLVLSADSQHNVLQVSTNLANFLDLPSEGVSGKPVRDLFDQLASEQIELLIQDAKRAVSSTCSISVYLGEIKQFLHARVFVSDEDFILELTPAEYEIQSEPLDKMFLSIQSVLLHADVETDMYSYFDRVASITRSLLNFDRVMVYHFDSNWDGEVIAESLSEQSTSYLGNRFPASDIPPQARRLYTKNLVRLVVDAEASPVDIVPAINPMTGRVLDLTYSSLRSFSSVHIEYLRNMGVQGSMSISLLQNGHLWGLIACHHMTKKHVPIALQDAATFISQMISSRLSLVECNKQLALEVLSNKILGDFLQYMTSDIETDLLKYLLPDLSTLLNASGVIIVIEGTRYSYGNVPKPADLDAMLSWLSKQSSQDILSIDHLKQVFPEASSYANIASGLLATPISSEMNNCIVWLRPEKLRTIKWAGNPEKSVHMDSTGSVRLSPRESFENWVELWQERSESWSHLEVCIARKLAGALTTGISQKSIQDKERVVARQTKLVREGAENSILKNTARLRSLADTDRALKLREQQHIDREKDLQNALIREVHHRIKNNLHGVMGILRRFSLRHKELSHILNDVIGQVNSVAVTHGLQGSNSSINVRLCELINEIVTSQKSLWQISINVDIPQKWAPCWIDETESVPVALVLNELVSNAVKHSTHATDVSLSLSGDVLLGKVLITIENSGRLSSDINTPNVPVRGTGLKLVASLMPESGAILSWEQLANKVLTRLELAPPIVSSEKEEF